MFRITLKIDKFVVSESYVAICRYKFSWEGISGDSNKTNALRDFPTSANLTDLRLFMRLVNHLAGFIPDIATTPQPIHTLMSQS